MKAGKVFSVLISIICFLTFIPWNSAKAEEILPQISFVGVEHSPLVEGEYESFAITSRNVETVQYRLFIFTEKDKSIKEISSGYSAKVQANVPYEIKYLKPFSLGKYKLLIRVKRAGQKGKYSDNYGDYDSIYTVFLNCVSKDDANRVYSSGEISPARNGFALGEKVKVDYINEIKGMIGPYQYKLHAYNATQSTWMKDLIDYNKHLEWIPNEVGNYVLDIWATSSNSHAKYEAWKLKSIAVEATQQYDKDGAIYGPDNSANPDFIDKSISITAQDVFLNNENIDKNLYILNNNVSLKNVNVKGKIIIDPNVEGAVSLNNVSASSIEIYSGKNILLQNVKASSLNIDSKYQINIEASGKTLISKLNLNTDSYIKGEAGNIPFVEITDKYSEKKNINLAGTIDNIKVCSEALLTSDINAVIKKINLYLPTQRAIELQGVFKAIDINKPGKINVLSNSVVESLTCYANADIYLNSNVIIKNLQKNSYNATVSGYSSIFPAGTSGISTTYIDSSVIDAYATSESTVEVKFERAPEAANLKDFILLYNGETAFVKAVKTKSTNTNTNTAILYTEPMIKNLQYHLYYKGNDTKKVVTYKGTNNAQVVTISPQDINITRGANKSFNIACDMSYVFSADEIKIDLVKVRSTQYGIVYELSDILKTVLISDKVETPSSGDAFYTYTLKGNIWGDTSKVYVNAVLNESVNPIDYTLTFEFRKGKTLIFTKTFVLKVK